MPKKRKPSYRLHPASGQTRVTIDGRGEGLDEMMDRFQDEQPEIARTASDLLLDVADDPEGDEAQVSMTDAWKIVGIVYGLLSEESEAVPA